MDLLATERMPWVGQKTIFSIIGDSHHMNDENWFNWLTGRRGTLFGDMKHEHEQRMAPPPSNFGSGGRTGQGEGFTSEGIFGFVAACFAMYYIRKVGVVWEWYWWVGAFFGNIGGGTA